MRVPLSWLREFVDVDLGPEALAERLTLLGMEVKGLVRWGEDWRNVVIGELLSVERHPRADRLSLTRVNVGDGEPLEIVCGATNIAAGQRVPVALPGAVLPGDRRIERTEKMGVVSNGMLCSGDELGLTADADGILILPADTPLGRPLAELFGDVVLDVDVKPNRGDALSIVGLAREVAAATGATLRLPPTDVTESGRPTAERLRVEVLDPDLCPRFVGRWVSGVQVGPSPDRGPDAPAGGRPAPGQQRGRRLELRHARARQADPHVRRRGRPRRADRRPPGGGRGAPGDPRSRRPRARSRDARDRRRRGPHRDRRGHGRRRLRGHRRDHRRRRRIRDLRPDQHPADGLPLRAPVRGEPALREGPGLRLARVGADRTARLILEWAGGEVASGVVDSNPVDPELAHVAFRPSRVNRLLGTDLGTDEMRSILTRVGIATAPAAPGTRVRIAAGTKPLDIDPGDAEVIDATVPSWRRDLAVEADITEEVIRVRGYELVPAVTPHTPMPVYRPDPLAVRTVVRRTLAGAGLSEVVTFALVAPRMVERFPPSDDGAPDGEPEQRAGGRPIVVTNPLSSQHSVLRQSLIGSLVEVVSTNLRQGRDDIAIFEVGKGYGAPGDPPTHEWWRLAFALTGAAEPTAWDRPARAFDLGDAKGFLGLVCRGLGFADPTFTPLSDDPNLHPGRAARVKAGGDLLGRVGELHPGLIDDLDLRAERIYVAEVALTGLAGGRPSEFRVAAPSRYPSVDRDVAVVVPLDTPAAVVEAAIARHAGPLLRDLTLFDIYRGRPLADTDKSLAYRLTLRDDERTLTEADLDAVIESVVTGLTTDIGARFRT